MLNINKDWFKQRSELTPDGNVTSGEEVITYAGLDTMADSYCSYLCKAGVKPGDNICILSSNTTGFIALLFGIWRAKAVPVPLNIKLTTEEINYQIEKADSKFLLIGKNLDRKPQVKNSSIKVLNFPFTVGDTLAPNIDYTVIPERTALIMFTSGSSGIPKGVKLSFANLYGSAVNADEIIEHTEKDRWLASLPFYHIGGFSIIIRSILFGASIVIQHSMNSVDIVKSLESYDPTLISLVPTNLKRMLESGMKPNKSLRLTLLGGGPSAKELAERAVNEGWNIVKSYGSTETASLISAVDCNIFPDKAASSGKALKANEIIILGENSSPCKAGDAGEIAVAGTSVFSGYFNEEEHSRSKFYGKYYLTGDYGYLDDEGYLFVLSRRTDLIVSGGENISPYEVEHKLNSLDNVIESCVFPLEDKEWGQIAAAAVVVKNNFAGVENSIQEDLRKILPSFKIPKKIFIVSEIPKTGIDKPKRDEMRKRFSFL